MLALITLSLPAFSQYSGADSLMLGYRESITKASQRLEVDPLVVESIVYPELMRYSALSDAIETSLVNGMYVRFGLSKGDFSIGIFQMKPSFVEQLERRWNLADSLPLHYQLYFNTMNRSEMARANRIRKMSSVEGQCLYAAVFLKLMYHCFPQLRDISPAEDRIMLLATAYNHGVEWPPVDLGSADPKSIEKLRKSSVSATFHTDLVATPFTQYLNYGKLAVEHYNFLTK